MPLCSTTIFERIIAGLNSFQGEKVVYCVTVYLLFETRLKLSMYCTISGKVYQICRVSEMNSKAPRLAFTTLGIVFLEQVSWNYVYGLVLSLLF